MKKLLVVVLLFSLAAGMAFADDAMVMPKGVIRAYFLGTYGSFDSQYDSDGDEQDFAGGEVSYFNQGIAVELGVTDQVTAAIQWVPGSNLSSSVEDDFLDSSLVAAYGTNPYGENTNMKLNGPADLFVGAKVQILGDKGFIENDQFRFAMAPGIRIPLDSYDASEEWENYINGDDWRASGASQEALGAGSRFYFDYVVNKDIYLNLYSEMIYNFPVEKKYSSIADSTATDKVEYKYGTDMVFEIEPNYKYNVTDKSNIYAGLPLNYEITQDVEVDGESQDDTGSKYLQLRPVIGYFCGDTMIPFDVSLRYGFPLMGENATKMQTFTLQVKVYARLYE
jgi:opacity protein-like surface antigen